MKILVPLAGSTPYFPIEEYPFSKPLIEIGGKPMIQLSVENLSKLSRNPEFVFVALRQESAQFSYPGILKLITGGRSTIVELGMRTAGALCSCLMAIEHINADQPLVIANYDQIIDGEFSDLIQRFEQCNADAGVLTFNNTHPRWSYVKTEGVRIVEASEKRVISRQAIAGIYWFRRGADFIDAAMNTLRVADAVDGQYFIAPALNQLILGNKNVVALPMRPSSQLHSFHLPARIQAFEQEIQLVTGMGHDAKLDGVVNIVIPAAGEGSRFAKNGYKAPKPFIDVLGQPMLNHVMENVAVHNSVFTVLLRQDHLNVATEAEEALNARNAVVVPVSKLTEGTACTVLLARDRFDNDFPLLIANSDQLVDFDCQAFVDDALKRGLDGSILVFRDAERDPKWSFAAVDENGYVTQVAEKKPISDLATVGIYFFTTGREFVKAAIDMIVRNDRVNNEFYTCPVYNYMISSGAKIGVYEVPAQAMKGLGTPCDLESYLESVGGVGTRSKHAPEFA